MALKPLYPEEFSYENFPKKKLKDSNAIYGIGDIQLWQEFQSGNEKAYALIYKNNVSLLYNYGLKIVNDKDLVKDAIQDLFVEIWDNRDNLAKVKAIKPYLYKSIKRKLISESVKNRTIENLEKATISKPLFSSSTEKRLIEKQNYDQQQQALNEALIKLTERQKEILHLKYNAQLSYEEITEVMSLSKKGAYKLVDRAIQALRKYMVIRS